MEAKEERRSLKRKRERERAGGGGGGGGGGGEFLYADTEWQRESLLFYFILLTMKNEGKEGQHNSIHVYRQKQMEYRGEGEVEEGLLLT